jgi:hypothetical protein
MKSPIIHYTTNKHQTILDNILDSSKYFLYKNLGKYKIKTYLILLLFKLLTVYFYL